MTKQLIERFNVYKTQLEVARKELAADCSPVIEYAAQQLFATAPEIESVFWVQYTPYFNDGEPCTFCVADIEYQLEGEDCDGEGSYLYNQSDLESALRSLENVKAYVADPNAWIEAYKQENPYCTYRFIRPYPSTVEEAQADVDRISNQLNRFSDEDRQRINTAFKDFYSVVQAIPEDILQQVFGDHVKVSITKQGLDVDHYDHD